MTDSRMGKVWVASRPSLPSLPALLPPGLQKQDSPQPPTRLAAFPQVPGREGFLDVILKVSLPAVSTLARWQLGW